MKSLFAKLSAPFKALGKKVQGGAKKTGRFIDTRPVTSFFVALVIILALIITGSILRRPDTSGQEETRRAIPVETFSIGTAPKIRTQAEIEKSGIIKVVAQTGGVIQQIQVKEGDTVNRGTNLAWISTNYQGGTASTVTRKKAQESLEFTEETYQTQKDIIGKQKVSAEEQRENTEKLREISDDSISESENLLNYNKELLDNVNEQIEELEQQGVDENDPTLVALKGQRIQFTASVNSLNQSLRSTRYQVDKENPPTDLADLQRDITLKNLEIQEKSLDLQKEIAQLDLRLAQISEALNYPASPCPGVVERVHVKMGQVVNPGDVIATITADHNAATAIAYVTRDIANDISLVEPALIGTNDTTLQLYPTYVTKEPVNGTLHAVYFSIPEEMSGQFSNGGVIDIELPVGYAATSSTIPFIPVDAVYQTQENAYVYVTGKNDEGTPIAINRPIKIGPVFGRFVQVEEGLEPGDQVIVNRNVIENDLIQTN